MQPEENSILGPGSDSILLYSVNRKFLGNYSLNKYQHGERQNMFDQLKLNYSLSNVSNSIQKFSFKMEFLVKHTLDEIELKEIQKILNSLKQKKLDIYNKYFLIRIQPKSQAPQKNGSIIKANIKLFKIQPNEEGSGYTIYLDHDNQFFQDWELKSSPLISQYAEEYNIIQHRNSYFDVSKMFKNNKHEQKDQTFIQCMQCKDQRIEALKSLCINCLKKIFDYKMINETVIGGMTITRQEYQQYLEQDGQQMKQQNNANSIELQQDSYECPDQLVQKKSYCYYIPQS